MTDNNDNTTMNDTNDTDDEGTVITCGCGEYSVTVTGYDTIHELDVVCPVCENHFGFGRSEVAGGDD